MIVLRASWIPSSAMPLAFSAWIVLLIYPDQLYNLGFQLSYAVVGAIILIGLPTSSAICNRISAKLITQTPTPLWRRWLNKLILGTVDLSCISMSAGIVSMPLIMETKVFLVGSRYWRAAVR